MPHANSAGASLHEDLELQQLALNFLAAFLVVVTFVLTFLATFFSLVVALKNNRHTSAHDQKIFTQRRRQPLKSGVDTGM